MGPGLAPSAPTDIDGDTNRDVDTDVRCRYRYKGRDIGRGVVIEILGICLLFLVRPWEKEETDRFVEVGLRLL